MTAPIYTIGHSNHTWDTFAALLRQHGIRVLADVRSNPVSRFAPFASKRTLPTLLGREGIRYVFLGDALGGKPSDPSCYDENGKPDYRKMRSQESFQEAIAGLLKLAEESPVALMCSEEDPSKCHRRLLIGPALAERGVHLLHIRADGSVQGSESLAHKKASRKQFCGTLPL